MKGGNAKTAQPNHNNSCMKIRHNTRERNAQPGAEESHGYQPRYGSAVGDISIDRLHGRGNEVRCKHDGCRSRVTDVMLRNEKWEECRDRSLVKVACSVGEHQKSDGSGFHNGS